jgi:hypothetical protein
MAVVDMHRRLLVDGEENVQLDYAESQIGRVGAD